MNRILSYALSSALLCGAAALPQKTTPPPTPKPAAPAATTPPILTADQKLAYFKAHDELVTASAQAQQANQVAQQKQVAFNEVVDTITKVCGKDFQPTIDGSRDPACVAKPPADIKPEPKPEPKK